MEYVEGKIRSICMSCYHEFHADKPLIECPKCSSLGVVQSSEDRSKYDGQMDV